MQAVIHPDVPDFDPAFRSIFTAIVSIPLRAPLDLLRLKMLAISPDDLEEEHFKAMCLNKNWHVLHEYMQRREGGGTKTGRRRVQLEVMFKDFDRGGMPEWDPWDVPPKWQRVISAAFASMGFEARIV